MSKHYYGKSSRNSFDEVMTQTEESSSINFNDPIDLDDENEVAAEEEAVVNEPVKDFVEEAEPPREVEKDEPISGIVNTLSNMRNAPDLDSDILVVIKEDTKVKILDRALKVNEFYHIKYNGLDGYILESLCDIGV